MEGVITNFRRGRHTVCTNQMIVQVKGYDSRKKSEALVGKSIVWHSPGKVVIKGTIKKQHGNSGAVKAHFDKGMPGQSIGTKVTIE